MIEDEVLRKHVYGWSEEVMEKISRYLVACEVKARHEEREQMVEEIVRIFGLHLKRGSGWQDLLRDIRALADGEEGS
ncbi:MAG: hypothetical protein ACREBG_17295 [Pyrinomonadaceae bacterium]